MLKESLLYQLLTQLNQQQKRTTHSSCVPQRKGLVRWAGQQNVWIRQKHNAVDRICMASECVPTTLTANQEIEGNEFLFSITVMMIIKS